MATLREVETSKMARIPDGIEPGQYDELQVAARATLLDGLQALHSHLDAITVVGAQAIYLHSIDSGLTVAAFTTDADLSLDPKRLESTPLLQDAMDAAGFQRRDTDQPGLWQKTQQVAGRDVAIGVDLLVGEAFAGRGDRSVQMPPHDKMAGRRVAGLEAAVVDADLMAIVSLDPSLDPRVVAARVAGPAALLVAKARKIAERVARANAHPDRLVDKDAGDVIRLMLATDAEDTAARFAHLLDDDRTAAVANQGLRDLQDLFGARRTPGTEMAARALAGDPLADSVAAIAQVYLTELLPER